MTLSQLATDGRTVRFRMFDALDAQGQKLSQINGSRTSTVRKLYEQLANTQSGSMSRTLSSIQSGLTPARRNNALHCSRILLARRHSPQSHILIFA